MPSIMNGTDFAGIIAYSERMLLRLNLPIYRPFCVKITRLTRITVFSEFPRLYSTTTHITVVGITSLMIASNGVSARSHNVVDTPLKALHISEAVCLLLPKKHDVVLYLLSAWKTSNVLYYSVLNKCIIAIASVYRDEIPVLIATTRRSQPNM